ncbi:MAG: hypothetical protein JWO82_2693, partial [Akkermansiaceae bacterium]|nr:hypothetical protein [Akkermansiaceae bacterium]
GTPDAAPDADFDHDGKSNLIEYLLGTNPTNSLGDPGYTTDQDESGHVRFHFTRLLLIPGITVRIVASDTLDAAGWTTLASKVGNDPWTTADGVTVSDDPATGAVVVTDSATIDSKPARFLRLEASKAE